MCIIHPQFIRYSGNRYIRYSSRKNKHYNRVDCTIYIIRVTVAIVPLTSRASSVTALLGRRCLWRRRAPLLSEVLMEGDSAASTPPVGPISFSSCRTDSPLELGNRPRAITAIAPADPASPFIVVLISSLRSTVVSYYYLSGKQGTPVTFS